MDFIGKTIKNRYKIYDKIGSGGMAVVYLARDLRTNEVVAIKILYENYANSLQYVKRFLKEAEIALKMKHKNIVKIKDFGKLKNTYFIIMEYIQGKTLEEIIKEKGTLSVEETIKIATEVARALQYAHKHGLIAHRDIKPQNIMITTAGNVKVMDFGIAKATGNQSLTTNETIIGTPFYLSPEQAKGLPPDIRSDLYSLGITMYYALTGQLPYEGNTSWSVINMHINAPVPKIENANIPEKLKEVVSKLLQKEPEARYQTPKELLEDLTKFEKNAAEYPIKTVILPKNSLKKINTANIEAQHTTKEKQEIKKKKSVSFHSKSDEIIKKLHNLENIHIPYVKSKTKKIAYIIFIIISILAIIFLHTVIKKTLTTSNFPKANTPTQYENNGTKPLRNSTASKAVDTPISESKKSGSLTINTIPEGAKIILDGKDTKFTTPCIIKNLEEGTYTITLEKKDYRSVTQEIEIKNGQTTALSIKLNKNTPLAYLSINSEPENAEIIIDGVSKGVNTPNLIKITPGKHKIMLKKKGYHTFEKEISLKNGDTLKLKIQLQKIIPGQIMINSIPQGAKIYVDGRNIYHKTPYILSLPPGTHTISLSLEGYEKFETVITVKENKTSTLQAKLKKTISAIKSFKTKNYRFMYPDNWTLTSHPDNDTDVKIDSPAYEDDYMATCFIYTDDLKKEGIDFDTLLKRIKTTSEADLTPTSESYVTINNTRYYKLVMVGTGEDTTGNSIPLKTAFFFLKKGDIIYTIECDATPNDFPDAWKGFLTILKSFTLTP